MKRDRIIFLSAKDPFSKKDWSGIPYFMFQSLIKIYEVEYVPVPLYKNVKLFGYYLSKLWTFIFNKKYAFDYGLIMAWLYGISSTTALRNKKDYQFIFSPAGLTETAFTKSSLPIVSYGDCSTLQLIGYYPALSSVSSFSKREINFVESKALNKMTLAVFTSAWAASFAQNQFKISRTTILPFGANISGTIGDNRSTEFDGKACNILFVGVDWERKGGSAVLKIHQGLLNKGIKSKLTIIGTAVIADAIPENTEVIEYLDKNTEDGEKSFKRILSESNFFLLPTLADCTPIVIAEAFSFGIPVLASRTGGIPSMVTENVNGFLFELNDAEGYVDKIMQLCNDLDNYKRISRNCIDSYQKIFNWDSWAKNLKDSVQPYLR